jgi:hypothetical protein
MRPFKEPLAKSPHGAEANAHVLQVRHDDQRKVVETLHIASLATVDVGHVASPVSGVRGRGEVLHPHSDDE